MAYITQAELEGAVGAERLITLLDDDNDGVVDSSSLDAVIARASALTDAWVAPVYTGPFPITQTPVPAMIRELTIQYSEAMLFERKPEVGRTTTDESRGRWTRADAMGERLQAAVLRITDYAAQAKPSNVGGIVTDGGQRIITTSADGTSNRGDF